MRLALTRVVLAVVCVVPATAAQADASRGTSTVNLALAGSARTDTAAKGMRRRRPSTVTLRRHGVRPVRPGRSPSICGGPGS
jgi:hypothetical protein